MIKKYITYCLLSASLLLPFVQSAPVFAATGNNTDAPGTNISSNGTIYFYDGTSLRPYTSAGAFASYGFNASSAVVQASAADLTIPVGTFVPPMDGSLINDHGTVWVISKGQKLGFTDSATFSSLGYAWSNVIDGDASFLQTAGTVNPSTATHPIDSVISSAGTDYLVTSKGLVTIPSQAVFSSWGYAAAKVLPANAADMQIAVLSNPLPSRPATALSAGSYYVDNIYNQSAGSDPSALTAPASANGSSGGSGSAQATTTGTPIPNASLTQCGTATSCLTQHAQLCTPAEGSVALQNVSDSDVLLNGTIDLQIIGMSGGNCNYQTAFTTLTATSFVASYQQQLSSSGETAQQIANQLGLANSFLQFTLNQPNECSQPPALLTAMIQRWQQDTYADSDANSCSSANQSSQ